MQGLRLKLILGALTLGVLASFATGLIPNDPGMSLPEIKRYGRPLFWLITNLNGPTEYVITNLLIDMVFWVTISFIALFLIDKTCAKLEITVDFKSLFLPLVLFVPLGLLMDVIHELGHGVWGTLVGGRLTYIQIAYFIIYPSLAVTPQFRLGAAGIEGLPYGSFSYGLMLLGGSMTTSTASWVIAIILLKMSLSNRAQVALKVLGLFGILDLPFYIVFPQMGLGHWIFLGGCGAEPLNGTRMMGIPDFAFYLAVVISTFGLVFFYFRHACEKALKGIKMTFDNLYDDRRKMLGAFFGSIICGALVSLVTGLIENPPEASIIGATYYGHPFVWRIVKSTLDNATDFKFVNLVIDTIFWTTVSFLIWVILRKITESNPRYFTSKSSQVSTSNNIHENRNAIHIQ